MKINFVPLEQQHLKLIHKWFQEPSVKKWYARGLTFSYGDIEKKYLPRIQGDEQTPSYIININDQNIGFIQYYSLINGFPEGITNINNALFKLQQRKNICGIDLFIAEGDLRGKGIGVDIINNFIERFLTNNFKMICIDPSIDNLQAVRCYEKSGFEPTNFSEDHNHIILIKNIDNSSSHIKASDNCIYLIYDGKCLLCSHSAKALKLKAAVGELVTIDARSEHPLVTEVLNQGYDLNEGIIVKYNDVLYHGTDAVHLLALLSSPVGVFNRINAYLFKYKLTTKLFYPVFKFIRNLLLFVRGIPKINRDNS